MAVSIHPNGPRVEFDGAGGGTHVVVPLLFSPGRYRDIRVKVEPCHGIALKNEACIGDVLRDTFSKSGSSALGISLIGSGSLTLGASMSRASFEVVSLPDFRGVLFTLRWYSVRHETVGIQLAFPIARWELREGGHGVLARVTLLKGKRLLHEALISLVPSEVAARVLVLSGYPQDQFDSMFDGDHRCSIAGRRFQNLELSDVQFVSGAEAESTVAGGHAGVHLYTAHVDGDHILFGNSHLQASRLFASWHRAGVRLVYMDTCNSVRVVRAAREAGIDALVASTGWLYSDYAEAFAERFYEALGDGATVSSAFRAAADELALPSQRWETMGLVYDPMFLEIKEDTRFVIG